MDRANAVTLRMNLPMTKLHSLQFSVSLLLLHRCEALILSSPPCLQHTIYVINQLSRPKTTKYKIDFFLAKGKARLSRDF